MEQIQNKQRQDKHKTHEKQATTRIKRENTKNEKNRQT